MILDLIILSIIVVFAVIGSLSGAARQIAQLVALGVGFLCARPLGGAFGSRAAHALHIPELLGVIVATILFFILVMASVRLVLTHLLRKMLAGGESEARGLDRSLGLVLGGAKVAFIAYFMLSALSFVEDNVAFAGGHFGLSPRDSLSFALARRYNLFETIQFRPVKDLVRIAEALNSPSRAAKLKKDPAFRALIRDPRFERSLGQEAMQKAIVTGDYRSLLRNDDVLQLIREPKMAARLKAAADAAD